MGVVNADEGHTIKQKWNMLLLLEKLEVMDTWTWE